MKVAVVILNYNGAKLLKQFLPSVIEHTPSWCEIIVADNASTDNSLQVMKEHFPQIKIIPLSENTGFAGGYNRALKQVDSEYYVLLNSDIEVTAQWIEPVIQFMDANEDVVACQPKILAYHQKDEFEHAGASGGFMDYLGYPFCRGRLFNTIEKDSGQYDQPTEIFWASGACMFIRSKEFHAAGALDEHFFAHMEEIDLCWRLKRKGLKLFCFPQSHIFHVGGGTLHKSNPRKTYLNFRNNLMMLYKNLPPQKMLPVFISRIILDKLAAISFLFSGNVKDTIAVYKAYFYILKNLKRLRMQRNNSEIPFREVSNIYKRSLVSAYYLKKQHRFSELDPTQFTQ